MRLLLLALLRQLAAHPWASLSVLGGVTLAMASVVAVHVLSDRVGYELERSDPASLAGLSHGVSHAALTAADYVELRRRWREGTLRIRIDGAETQSEIAAMTPMLQGEVASDERRYLLFAADPLALPDGPALAGAASLMGRDAVLAHRGLGLEPGETLQLGPDGARVQVVGHFGTAQAPPRNWLLADIATGQRLLAPAVDASRDEPGRALDGIALALERPLPAWLHLLEALFPGLASQLEGAGYELEIGAWPAALVGDAGERRFVDAIRFNLAALSMLAALVAAFLIYQSGVGSIRQRALLLERLHAIGVAPAIVKAHLCAEGLVLGLAGAALGLPLGLWLADLLLAVTMGGLAVPAGAEVAAQDGAALARDLAAGLPAAAILKALGFGIGAGLIGMWLAERAVRGGERGHKLAWSGALAGGAGLVAGVGLPASGSPGGFVAIAGLSLLALAMLPFLLRGITGAWLRAGAGLPLLLLLNLREIRATLADVQAAAGALLLALAVAIGLGVMVASLRGGFDEMISQRLAADLVLETQAGGFTAKERALLREREEIVAVRGYRQADLHVAGVGPIRTQIARLDAWELSRYGQAGEFEAGSVYVGEPAAQRYGLTPGSEIELRGPQGSAAFTVAGVFRDYGAPWPRILVDRADAGRLIESAPPPRLAITLASGAPAEAVIAMARQQGWRAQTLGELRQLSQRIFERTFRITDALALLALLVAVVGLYNALTALQLKRRPEMALLHGLGFDRSALLRLSLGQSLLLTALVALLAIPLGLAIAWMLCAVVNPRAFGWSIPLTVTLRPIALPALLAMAAGAVAGTLPAWRGLLELAGGDHRRRVAREAPLAASPSRVGG